MQFAPQKQKALSGGPGERLQRTNIGVDRNLSRGAKTLKATKWSRRVALVARVASLPRKRFTAAAFSPF
jgi:hypothetical protein